MPMSLIAMFVFVWQPRDDPYYIPTLYVCEQFLGDEIDDMVRDVIRAATNHVVDEWVLNYTNITRWVSTQLY